ncbi:unnamed protein product [Arabidopsis halleri]
MRSLRFRWRFRWIRRTEKNMSRSPSIIRCSHHSTDVGDRRFHRKQIGDFTKLGSLVQRCSKILS